MLVNLMLIRVRDDVTSRSTMADKIAKAEKIAAARKRLKEHQQKSRETASTSEQIKSDHGAQNSGQQQFQTNEQHQGKNADRLNEFQNNVQCSNAPHLYSQVPILQSSESQHNGSSVMAYNNNTKHINNNHQLTTESGPVSSSAFVNRLSPLIEAKNFFDNLPSQDHDWSIQQTAHTLFGDHPVSTIISSSQHHTVDGNQDEFGTIEFANKVPIPETSTSENNILPTDSFEFLETFKTDHVSQPVTQTNSVMELLAETIAPPHNIELNSQLEINSSNIHNVNGTTINAAHIDSWPLVYDTTGKSTTPLMPPTLQEIEPTNIELPRSESSNSPRSTSENIRQISMQVHGLISESYQNSSASNSSELECRNQELAGLLEAERQRTEQMQLQLHEYQSRQAQHDAELAAARLDAESQAKQELVPLQEQLQIHIQTVGILVAEKTELQATLSQCQSAGKLRASEIEELQGRLKASRHRVSDLDKELNSLRATTEQGEFMRRNASTESDRLQSELRQMSERRQEVEDERDEINHRLSSKTSECVSLAQELYETRTQLSLTQLRVEQLSSPENADITSQLEDLHQAKVGLEQQVAALEAEVKMLTSEREDSAHHYQQYVATLDARALSLAEQQREMSEENRRLSERESSLVSHVEKLERRLQETSEAGAIEQDLKQALAEMQTRLSDTTESVSVMSTELQLKSQDIEQLQTEVSSRGARVEELEALLEHLQSDRPDQARLLAAMESDKVAASRAVAQNQQLKQELEELQAAFVTLSNCKLDLTDKLQHERHVTRELQLKIESSQASIEELSRQLSEGHASHDHHVPDDLNPINDILHRELAQSKERIEALSIQNSELRNLLAHQTPAVDSSKDAQLLELAATVQRMTEERDHLLHGNVADNARTALEERFRETMTAVAELTDEKQRLEHLVLQLQGETETIGEYITLYQKQRKLLCQRADEKDHQLKSLAQDREEMRAKLSQLNKLIQRLVAEKGSDATDAVLKDLTNSELTNGELAELRQEAEVSMETPTTQDAGTADKIMALLTEIGSSNLVDPQQLVEHFHPCPWCSGQLITV